MRFLEFTPVILGIIFLFVVVAFFGYFAYQNEVYHRPAEAFCKQQGYEAVEVYLNGDMYCTKTLRVSVDTIKEAE